MEALIGALTLMVFGITTALVLIWLKVQQNARTLSAITFAFQKIADNQVLTAKLLSSHQDTLATKVVLKENFLRELN
jgi:hypothetical protein